MPKGNLRICVYPYYKPSPNCYPIHGPQMSFQLAASASASAAASASASASAPASAFGSAEERLHQVVHVAASALTLGPYYRVVRRHKEFGSGDFGVLSYHYPLPLPLPLPLTLTLRS